MDHYHLKFACKEKMHFLMQLKTLEKLVFHNLRENREYYVFCVLCCSKISNIGILTKIDVNWQELCSLLIKEESSVTP